MIRLDFLTVQNKWLHKFRFHTFPSYCKLTSSIWMEPRYLYFHSSPLPCVYIFLLQPHLCLLLTPLSTFLFLFLLHSLMNWLIHSLSHTHYCILFTHCPFLPFLLPLSSHFFISSWTTLILPWPQKSDGKEWRGNGKKKKKKEEEAEEERRESLWRRGNEKCKESLERGTLKSTPWLSRLPEPYVSGRTKS